MLPLPQSHPTDLPLGSYAYHNKKMVKVFGRERDENDRVELYWVVDESVTPAKRYTVRAGLLTRG